MRKTWADYGIDSKRKFQLKKYCKYAKGKDLELITKAAYKTQSDIAEFLILSVTKKLSYDKLIEMWELKKINRIPCGRTDFYGYRRYFYYLLDVNLRENMKNGTKFTRKCEIIETNKYI